MKDRLTTLGIDLGTNSLGWCLIETSGEPCSEPRSGKIIAIGSRIFSSSEAAGRDAKSGESLACHVHPIQSGAAMVVFSRITTDVLASAMMQPHLDQPAESRLMAGR